MSASSQHASPATRMLERRRQMIELQQELTEQQALYAVTVRQGVLCSGGAQLLQTAAQGSSCHRSL